MRLLAAALVVSISGCAEGAQDFEISSSEAGARDARSDGSSPDTAEPIGSTGDSGTASTESGAIFETECDGGIARCSGVCTDTNTDEANCGMCGTACAAGERCVAGTCELPCTAPTVKCGSACVNTNTDEMNCGTCGAACAAGETCTIGKCVQPSTTVTFPSTASTTYGTYPGSGTLGAGGGARFYVSGDYVQESFSRATAATKLTVNFRMSDNTSSYCTVGTLTWNVLVNGTVVGSYSWLGGSGGDKTIAQTYSFASIAPVSGKFTLRYQATRTVCSGGGSWNWYAGGTATLQ